MNVRHSPILEALLPWRIIAFLAPLLLLLAPIAIARSQSSLQQGADSSPFRPLDLPTPTDVRSGSGRPGAKYWQQRVDYKIAATLDPARNELRGRETIHYINRSPDALPYLWLFVEQNLCAPNSITSQAANKSSFQISTSRTAFTTTGGLAGSPPRQTVRLKSGAASSSCGATISLCDLLLSAESHLPENSAKGSVREELPAVMRH